MIRRVPVSSSSIASIGYDEAATTLDVAFHTGYVYRFHLVAPRVHAELMAAPSHGRYFNTVIRPRYEGIRLE